MAKKQEDKEVVLKDVPVTEANDNPQETVPVAEVPDSSVVQANVAGPLEAKVGPVQPEAPSASDVAEALSVDIEPVVDAEEEAEEIKHGFHKISAADMENYPELKDQGAKEGSQVAYNSLRVFKYATADRTAIVPVPWPTNITGTLV